MPYQNINEEANSMYLHTNKRSIADTITDSILMKIKTNALAIKLILSTKTITLTVMRVFKRSWKFSNKYFN